MPTLLLHTIALEPNRWEADRKPYFSLSELLPRIADAGFHHVELWQNHFAHAAPSEIREISKEAGDRGISFPVAGMYPTLNPTGETSGNMLKEMEEVLDRALLLGASVVKIFVGRKDHAVMSEQEYRTSVRSLGLLLRSASSRRMMVAGEVHENTLFSGVDAAHAVLHDVGDPNFKVCFQPLDFTDTAATLSAFGALRDHIVHMHFQGRKDGTLSLLKEADIDYGRLLHAMAETDYDDTMTIEFVKDCVVSRPEEFDLTKVMEHAQRDRDFLITLGARNGLDVSV